MVYYIFIYLLLCATKIAQIIYYRRAGSLPGDIQVLPAGTYNGSVPEGMYVHSVPDSVPAVPGYVLPVCGRRLRMGEWYYTTVVPGYLPLPPMQKLHFREFTWLLCRAR